MCITKGFYKQKQKKHTLHHNGPRRMTEGMHGRQHLSARKKARQRERISLMSLRVHNSQWYHSKNAHMAIKPTAT